MNRLVAMMEQVRKMKSGNGVQAVLDEAYKIMGNPIVLFNTQFKLLAHTHASSDDLVWNETVSQGAFSQEMRRFFLREGFIEDIANASKSVLLKCDKLKYARICGKIYNKNNAYIATLMIVESGVLFEEYDSIVFDAICKLVTKEISKNEYFQEYEQTHQETVINSLLSGEYDVKLDTAQVGILYDALDCNLYLVVADLSPCHESYGNAAAFKERLKQLGHLDPSTKYAIYGTHAVAIVSTDCERLNVREKLGAFLVFLERHNLYAGVSRRFENLFELEKHFASAKAAMACAARLNSDQRIFPCCPDSMEKMRQIENLQSGMGIQTYLNIGPGIFGNPLLFHDMELNLLAYSEGEEIADPIWEELITYGTSSDETIELFKTEGFIQTMENTKGGALLISDNIKYDRISWRIYSRDNIMIGCLSIVNSMRPFSEDELILFGAFSQKFSMEVGKIEFYNNYGQVYSGTVINRMLSGKIDDYTFYSEDIGNLYAHLMENLYLVVVSTAHCKGDPMCLSRIRDLFNWPGAVNRYALYEDYIVAIISVDSLPLCEKREFKEISRLFEQENIYAGVSDRFENMYELQERYRQAVAALKAGLEKSGAQGDQRVFQFGSEIARF